MDHIGFYLKDIYFQKKSGRLVFKHEQIQKYLFFQEGFLVFTKTNHPDELLGQVLYKLGKISDDTHLNLDQHIEPRKNIGQTLISKGLLTQKDLHDGLMYQMREVTLNIFPIYEGEFIFQQQDEIVDQTVQSKISVPVLIEDGIRRIKYSPSLKQLMETKIPAHKDKEFFYRLTEEEKEILAAIDGKTPADSILKSSNFREELFWKGLYLLYCLGIIDVQSEATTPLKGEKAKKEPSDDAEDRIAEIRSLKENLSTMDYYQLLDVARDAPQVEVKKAYFHMARKYHPDRFDRDLISEAKETIEEVFDHITKAYRTLISDEERKKYDARRDTSVEEDRRDKVKLADIKFRQGKTLFNQGRYQEALILLEEAVRFKRNKGAYFLLLAMTELRLPALHRKAETDFLKAIKLEPWNPEGYVGLGLLYKKEGLVTKAGKQFKKALTIDSEHSVALKELGAIEGPKKKGFKEIFSFDLFGKKKKK